MVSLFSSLSFTDLKKIAIPDQILSSQRRKVASPCSFGVVLFFIVLSAFLFGFSSKGPFLQGLYNLGSQGNISFLSWHYPGPFGNNTDSRGCETASSFGCKNETLDGNFTVSNGRVDSVNLGGEEKVSDSALLGNQTVKFKDGSFNVSQPVGNVNLIDGSGKGQDSEATLVGESIDDVNNGSTRWKGDGVKGDLGRGNTSENHAAKSVVSEHSSCVGNCSNNSLKKKKKKLFE